MTMNQPKSDSVAPASGTGAVQATALQTRLEHRFSIVCGKGHVRSDIAGEVPGGTRLHLTYIDGSVVPNTASENPLSGFAGRVLSGGDWVLIRKDGVATFDGRITIKTDDGFLADARLSGLVDLDRKDDPNQDPTEAGRVAAYTDWRLGNRQFSFALPLQFEASGPKENWVQEKYRKMGEMFRKYGTIVLRQFLAVGSVDMSSGRIEAVTLHVFEVCPPSVASVEAFTHQVVNKFESKRKEGK